MVGWRSKSQSKRTGWPNADLRVGSGHLHPDAYLQGHCQTAQFAKSLVLRMLTARFCSGLLYLLLFSRQRLSNTVNVAEFAGVWSQPKASLRWLARGCCSCAGDGLCAEMGMGSDAVGHPRGQAGSLGGISWGKRETRWGHSRREGLSGTATVVADLQGSSGKCRNSLDN